MSSTGGSEPPANQHNVNKLKNFSINYFDKNTETFEFWKQRFDLEASLNEITDENIKKMLLLKYIGTSNFQLVYENFAPVAVAGITYAAITAFLTKSFVKKISYLAERLKFGETRQSEQQSLTEYTACLRAQANKCKFGATLSERLRDQFVLGISNPQIKQEIIKKFPSETATFADVEDHALTIELAIRDGETLSITKSSTALTSQPLSMSTVNKIFQEVLALHPKTMCLRCGYNRHHNTQDCKAIEKNCNSCGEKGHFERACVKTGKAKIYHNSRQQDRQQIKIKTKDNYQKRMQRKKVNTMQYDNDMEEESFTSSDSDSDSSDTLQQPARLNAIQQARHRRYTIDVSINDVPVCMEYDTGASCSVINEQLWREIR